MISTVIPCYNAADDVGEAIESVLHQTRQDWVREIIVVDDGSTDRSKDVIRHWATSDSRIQYVYQENQGPSVARNTGVAQSSQEYIAFLDADDCWLKRKIEVQARFLKEHPTVGLLYSDAYKERVDGERRRIWATHLDYREENNLERLFMGAGPVLTPTVVMKKCCFEQLGGFDPSLPMGQDADMWLRTVGEYPIHHLSAPLVLVRKRQGSVASNTEKKAKYRQDITRKIMDLYPRVRDLKDERESHIEYYRGVNFLYAGEKGKAISSFWSSVYLDMSYWKSYFYLLVSIISFDSNMACKIIDSVKNLRDSYYKN